MRGGLALTEPDAGTDLQGIRMTARRDGDHYVINGTKTWISNGIEGSCLALLVKTNPDAQPRHNGHEPVHRAEAGRAFASAASWTSSATSAIDSAELVFEDYRLPADHLIGGVEGQRLLPGRPAGWSSAASTSLRAASALPRAR